MKKFVFVLSIVLSAAVIGCNNSGTANNEVKDPQKAEADSLEKEVMDGHDVGMAKMSKMSKLKQEAQRLIDSIDKLPAKAREAAAPYKSKLESLANDLKEAGASMNKWMKEFQYDSAKDNLEQRIKYLTDEKSRVGKVKAAILESLQKADSVLKSKF
jgi:hypothetical protein